MKLKLTASYLRTAFDFLELDNEMILSPGIVSKGTKAEDLLTRLRNRNLFKVALELGEYPRCGRLLEIQAVQEG